MGIDHPIDITTEQRKIILSLLDRHLPNTTTWVYGSRAKWSARPESDLDMVVFAKPEQSDQVIELREAFEKSDLPFRVDLFTWDTVPEHFREQITADHRVLMQKKKRERANRWRNVTLGDYIEVNDATYSPKEAWREVNYLDTGSISENRISEIKKLFVGRDKIPSRARRKVQLGDIVYSTVRPNQRHYGRLRKLPENLLVSTGFAVMRGKKELACTEFIYWFLAQDHIVEQLQAIAEHSTSAYPSIKPKDIEELTLDLPPPREQRAIAHVLCTLDDKIELNQRMNKTLEAMAQALFKSWFVDFDPVHAKAALKGNASQIPSAPEHRPMNTHNGAKLSKLPNDANVPIQKGTPWTTERARSYLDKMDPTIAALFPDRMVDSELGAIPEGWRVASVGEHAANFDAKRVPLSKVQRAKRKGRYPYHGASGVIDHVDDYIFDGIYALIGEDGSVVKENGMAVTQYVWDKFWVNNHAHVLQGKGAVSTEQIYLHFFFRPITPYVTGAVQPKLSQKRMNSVPFVHSGNSICEVFAKKVASLFTQIRQHTASTKTLINLRDTLLPKLMSGELRPENAEILALAK